MVKAMDLYRTAVAKNLTANGTALTRYIQGVVDKMPPPPDPFWSQVEL